MLKTALKPKWLIILVLSLVIATLFVLLSKWQFEQAEAKGSTEEPKTETTVSLTEHFKPGQPLMQHQADQLVYLSGKYLPKKQVYIQDRLREGVKGYWVVTAFEVEGGDGNIIPVVRGWQEDLAAAKASKAPDETLYLEGRLLPPDAPDFGYREDPEVFRSLSTAELINIWDVKSYAATVVQFRAYATGALRFAAEEQGLEPVYVGPQPPQSQLNLLNVFYAVEWVFFAGFALFLWFRLVRDDHRKDLEQARLDEEWAQQWYREQGYIKEENHDRTE
ncbi:SURF1 family protein [Micrococcoides hystricis]|uniref:SURF1-like protein n=1 Tax=Micrococcoides hystricis TaxID=1572761 RepID=A0ABV6P9Z0_9MICC